MAVEPKTAQLRVKPRCIIAEGAGGTIFWASPTRARLLLDAGAVDLVNAPDVGPTEQPSVGPTETKPAGPTAKKSSAVDPDGHSTDSAPSSEPGTATPSSVSAAVPASPLTNAEPLAKPARGRPRKSGR